MAAEATVSTTPNENALKFTLNCPAIEEGYKTYNNLEDAGDNAAAKALFAIDGVTSVFMMADFVTVTKKPEASWDDMQPACLEAIKASY